LFTSETLTNNKNNSSGLSLPLGYSYAHLFWPLLGRNKLVSKDATVSKRLKKMPPEAGWV
jgi:hypothetical protein